MAELHEFLIVHPEERQTFGVAYEASRILLFPPCAPGDEQACLVLPWEDRAEYASDQERQAAQHDWLRGWIIEHRPRVQDGRLYALRPLPTVQVV